VRPAPPAGGPYGPAGFSARVLRAVVSATNSGVARTVARGPHIGELSPANKHFGQQPSNPRAQVRLLPGPSWLFMGISSCDPGCAELRGAGARPLKTARDRLSTARTGAHPAQQRGTGTSARHSRPELTALGLQQQREICPTWAYSHAATSTATPCGEAASSARVRPDRRWREGPRAVVGHTSLTALADRAYRREEDDADGGAWTT